MKDEQLNAFISYEDRQYIQELESKISKNNWEISKLIQQRSNLESENKEYYEKICKIKNKATLLVYANCPHQWEQTMTGMGSCKYGKWCDHEKYRYNGYFDHRENYYHLICKICGLVEGQPINIKTCNL
jgi:hypothetical protein